jgi:hypothetical protein
MGNLNKTKLWNWTGSARAECLSLSPFPTPMMTSSFNYKSSALHEEDKEGFSFRIGLQLLQTPTVTEDKEFRLNWNQLEGEGKAVWD